MHKLAACIVLERPYPSRKEDVIVCFHSLRNVEACEGVHKVPFGDIAGAQRVPRSGGVSTPVLGASRLAGESQHFNNFQAHPRCGWRRRSSLGMYLAYFFRAKKKEPEVDLLYDLQH